MITEIATGVIIGGLVLAILPYILVIITLLGIGIFTVIQTVVVAIAEIFIQKKDNPDENE